MNKLLLIVVAASAMVLGGCTSSMPTPTGAASGLPATQRFTPPQSPPPPSPPPAEPAPASVEYTPPPLPPPPPAPTTVEPAPRDLSPSSGSSGNACDPNYTGACVPIASDVDCAGGSGNGPAYVQGPVRVVGQDIYHLDSNHDGVGCE